jgi:quercetin dioxygenase-like cupin family protein
VPVIRGAALEFATLPGRQAADPFVAGRAQTITGSADSSVRVVRIAPGPRTPHRHPRSSEVVYVAAGTGVAWEDGRRTDVAAGDLVAIPRGVPHATVAGDDGLLLVCFFPDPDLASNLEELPEPQIEITARSRPGSAPDPASPVPPTGS